MVEKAIGWTQCEFLDGKAVWSIAKAPDAVGEQFTTYER